MSPKSRQALEPRTDPFRRSPVWLKILMWVVGALAMTSLAIGGWAHGTLWGHEQRICRNENEIKNVKEHAQKDSAYIIKALDKLDAKVDKILLPSVTRNP